MAEERESGRRDYRPTWRCENCGTRYDVPPERCDECDGDSFRAIEQWSG